MKTIGALLVLLFFGTNASSIIYECTFDGIAFEEISDGGIFDLPGHRWVENEEQTKILTIDTDISVAMWEIAFAENLRFLKDRKISMWLVHDTNQVSGPYSLSIYFSDTSNSNSDKTINSNTIYYEDLPSTLALDMNDYSMPNGYYHFSLRCTEKS